MDNKRRHDMDALRALAMLLGISFHIALAYTGYGWIITDQSHHTFFDWLNTSSHGFRMPLFFLISGFFTAMLWKKRGISKLLSHRFKRILLPCVVAVWTIGFAVDSSVEYALKNQKEFDIDYEELAKKDNDRLTEKINNVWTMELIGGKALAITEEFNFWPHGKGAHLGIKTEKPLKVYFDDGRLRSVENPVLAFEVSYRNYSNGSNVILWYAAGKTEAAHRWLVNQDYSISPQTARHLSLGLNGTEIVLVEKGHEKQLVFKNPPKNEINININTENQFDAKLKRQPSEFEKTYYQFLKQPGFTKGVFAHMWFLWFLCWLVILFALAVPVFKFLKLKIPQNLVEMPSCFLWLIPLTMIPQQFMNFGGVGFGPDTSLGMWPYPHTLLYYTIFFGFGAIYFGRDKQVPRSSLRGWLLLAIGLFALFPMAYEVYRGDLLQGSPNRRLTLSFLQAAYVWVMIFAGVDLFRWYFNTENKVMRYISDSSYWMYLAHMPLVFLGQHLVRNWDVNAFVKFTVLNVAIFSMLLASYHILVRSTPIGTFLNGKRYKFMKDR